ncbi:diacylglycerol O-acyltransferase 3, cytosolic [Iris pallida]|uniref:Diacylglycerol O-acyltransferase 3, cytosolic n=1 Tax=Iris pallida TaxID=29817 RepID=A0AAX6I298_IRIPA|nr:diacylglycerol O-acyltransferase 3, cytosolic [Iris pallida]
MATATIAGSATCSRRGLAGRSFSSRLVRPATVSFSDEGHLRYYASARCAIVGERKKKKEEGEKRRDKLMKGLRKDLMEFSSLRLGGPDDYDAGGREGNVVAGEAESKMISEAADVLLAQLTQLRTEAKEMKRRRKKEKKAAIKSAKTKDDTSSSSSSESSDGECDTRTTTVVKMSRSIRTTTPEIPQELSSPKPLATEAGAKNVMLETNAEAAVAAVVKAMDKAAGNKIEVCMGGKCKKSGAMELLSEFDRMVGVEGAVVGCKCMGKCREGPNVRVVNRSIEEEAKVSRNPLCIGVGLEDVGAIVGNFFGEGPKDVGFLVA